MNSHMLTSSTFLRTTQAWLIWLVAGCFYLYESIHRVAPGVMIQELMYDFSSSAAELGTLSACYYYAYAIVQIPVGILLDKFGPRLLLSLTTLMVSFGSWLFAETQTLEIAQFSRILIGLGSAFSFIGCLKLGTTWFPAKRFTLIIGLTNLLGVLGAIFGGRPLSIYVDNFTWRTTMKWSAFLGVLLAILLWLVIRDTPNHTQKHQSKMPLTLNCLLSLTNPQIWFISIFGGLMVAPITAYSELWDISYLMDHYHINKPIAAQIASFTFIGIALGSLLIGWHSDTIARRRLTMLIGCLGALCNITVILYFPWQIPLPLLTGLHLLFGFFSSSMLLCFSLNTEYLNKNIKGTCIGLTNTMIAAISVSLQPVVGKLLDIFNVYNINQTTITSDNIYQIAFLPLICCYTAGLILLFFIKDGVCTKQR